MNSETTEQRGEAEELRDEGGEMIATNNEESVQRSETVEELQDESKEVVQDIHLYYKNQMTNKHKIEKKDLNNIVHRDVRHHNESFISALFDLFEKYVN